MDKAYDILAKSICGVGGARFESASKALIYLSENIDNTFTTTVMPFFIYDFKIKLLSGCYEYYKYVLNVDFEHRVRGSFFVKLYATIVIYLPMREITALLIRIGIVYLVAEWIRRMPC